MADDGDIRRVDPVDRAHLTGRSRPTPPIHRYAAAADLEELVERFWLPVWSLAAPQTQTTLQHPVCLLVVTRDYARFYGATRGASSVTLDGEGWAAGLMLRPAAGALLLGGSVADVVDRTVDLDRLASVDGAALSAEVRAAMTADPHAEAAHAAVLAAYESRLRSFLPVDEEGRLVNAIVDWLLAHPQATRVAEVTAAFGLTERTLQRLVVRRVGLTPKWLIQRRRLHDAVLALKTGETSLSAIAADLGYTDQAHFTHDFRAVTGMTPGAYAADQPRTGPTGRA